MLQFEIMPARRVVIVKPQEPLETADFERLGAEVDALIRERGKLKGVLVDAPGFPGWASFAAFSAHRVRRDRQSAVLRARHKS